MKQIVIINLIFCSLSFGNCSAEMDGNDIVNFGDYWVLARDWQTSPTADPNGDIDCDGFVDINDLAIFVIYWLYGNTGNPPVANEFNSTAYTYITEYIDLSDYTSDDGIPVGIPLDYYIISTPNDSNVYLQDPASGCGIITEALCPYKLRNHGSVVWLAADNNETFNFVWKANDTIYDSCDANCTVVVSPNPQDCLSFDGQSYVDVPSDANLDFADGRLISFFINTRTPFSTVLKKRGNVQGYEIKIESGRPKLELYDSNGTCILSGRSDYRINDGQWHYVDIATSIAAGDNSIIIYTGTEATNYNQTSVGYWPEIDITNDSNLLIGYDYKWSLDNLRYYHNYNDMDALLMYFGDDIRNTAGGVGLLQREADVRWLMNAGSGNTITDDKSGLVGTIQASNHIVWTPWNWHWRDLNVLRKKRK